MQIFVISAFPGMIRSVVDESMMRRAQEKKLVSIETCDLRAFTRDKHRSVDDAPFGGGPGMILKAEPIFECVDHIRKTHTIENPRIILMSAAGTTFDQRRAQSLAHDADRPMILICGHYKGVDQRVVDHLATEEISIGDYILTGGELAAMVVIDAVVRLIPGVLGDFDSAEGDAFQTELLDHPHYTRPREYRGMTVPDILLSGDHARIEAWRKEQAQELTAARRQDLLPERDSPADATRIANTQKSARNRSKGK